MTRSATSRSDLHAAASPTRSLAGHVDRISLADLPDAVVQQAKLCVLDAIGCGIAGAFHPAISTVRRVVATARPGPGEPRASVWGTALRLGVLPAVMINASMTHVVNADDAHKGSMGHPGTVVVPAALGLAEGIGAHGRSLLEAVVGGYEAVLRVGEAIGVASHRARGWYAAATLGPMGAAAAAAKLLGLGADGIASAIGHAGAQASGLWAFTADGSLANLVYVGRAAESGVLGALLTQAGLKGPRAVLEAPDGGFLRAMSDSSDPTAILDRPNDFRILDVSLKPYPCSRTTHAPIDAALKIRARHATRPGWVEDLRHVGVYTYPIAKRQADIPEPSTEWTASLSIQYGVAVALLEGRVTVEHFTRSWLESQRVRELMDKVHVRVDDEIAAAFPRKWSCRVEVESKDGERTSERVDAARGDPANPLTVEAVREKFDTLTVPVLIAEARARIKDMVECLEEVPDVGRLASLLRGNGGGDRSPGPDGRREGAARG